MDKITFKGFVQYCVRTYGVMSYLDNEEDDDLWVNCPECDEPILFDDWKDDTELNKGCCPICGERLIEVEEVEN